jgi:CHAT domain-containing protein
MGWSRRLRTALGAGLLSAGLAGCAGAPPGDDGERVSLAADPRSMARAPSVLFGLLAGYLCGEAKTPRDECEANGKMLGLQTGLLFGLTADGYYREGNYEREFVYRRIATEAYKLEQEQPGANPYLGAGLRQRLIRHVSLARFFRDQPGLPVSPATLEAEAFEAAQLAGSAAVDRALTAAAGRLAAADPALAALVRKRLEVAERLIRLRHDEIARAEVTRKDGGSTASVPPERREAEERLRRIDAELAASFPAYASLAGRQAVPLAEVQRLLDPDEALVMFLAAERELFVWRVTRGAAELQRRPVARDRLAEEVAALRAGLAPTAEGTLPPYDVARAAALHRTLFDFGTDILAGVKHLLIVPDGPLQSLPFGVLPRSAPGSPVEHGGDYGGVDWLARHYAATTLPSVAALRVLRRLPGVSRAARPFVGVGDPRLEGGGGSARGPRSGGVAVPRRGIEPRVLQRLEPLPETAAELRAIAGTLGGSEDDLLLGLRATEARVRGEPLGDVRVLAFATHAAVAGELGEDAEPGLVLTPPPAPSAGDDGFLSAGEVAALDLNAEWVLLSACNTAAPDGTPGAEGLSGLARAFFSAGARSLLVSHWAVLSEATVRLTTATVEALAREPGLRRSEGLRRAMVAMMDGGSPPHLAHPAAWGPFVVVGDGGPLAGGARTAAHTGFPQRLANR